MSKIQIKEVVGKINTGADALKKAPIVPFETGLKCLRIGDVSNKREVREWGNTIVSESVKDSFSLKKDDIVIARTGNTIGTSTIISQDLNAVYNNGLIRVQTNDKCYAKYFYYNIASNTFKNYIKNISLGNSTQANIRISDLLKFEINLPPLHEQQKIASVLSALDDQIELNNKINQELEDFAQTLYNYWFVQFEFPNEEGKPYKSSGGKMVWNEELKREIPEGWEVKRLGEELIFERGVEPGSKNYKTLKGDGDIKFYRVSDMENDSSTYINSSLAVGKTLDETDVVVSFDGTVGRIGFGLKGAYSTGMRKIYDENGNFNNALIYFIFKDEGIQNIIKKHATGSNILHAGGAIKYLSIPYDKKVFAFFKDKITPLFNEILLNKKQNQELIQLRDYLLPLLMNGQVTVSDELFQE